MNTQTKVFTGSSRTLGGQRNEANSSSWLNNILEGRNSFASERLEELIDINQNLTIFSNEQLSTLNPKRLYGHGILSFFASVFRHHRIEPFHLPDGKEKRINLMIEESARHLLNKRHNYIHLGLIIFGLRGLTKTQVGGKVLLVLYDSHFSDKEKAIMGLIEVDMNNNLGITYLCLNSNTTI